MIMCFLFESSFESVKHKIALFAPAICLKPIQHVGRGIGEERVTHTEAWAVDQCLAKLEIGCPQLVIPLLPCMFEMSPR